MKQSACELKRYWKDVEGPVLFDDGTRTKREKRKRRDDDE